MVIVENPPRSSSDLIPVVTHAGVFHADEVLGTAILEMAFGNLSVARFTEVPRNLDPDIIVYDIGYGRYDHHQLGGNGCRDNGVPYASAGLLWNEFGRAVVESSTDPEFLWKHVDESLIQGVDAADNGSLPTSDDMNRVFSFTKMIASFNPEWDSPKAFDDAFLEAVGFARVILEKILSHGSALIRARAVVEQAIDRASGQVMVLDEPVPWKEALLSSGDPKAQGILFVVYPSDRGGYVWQGVPDSLGSYRQRKEVPMRWRGLHGSELQEVTGVPTAMFCHQKGFAGSAEALSDAILLATMAAES